MVKKILLIITLFVVGFFLLGCVPQDITTNENVGDSNVETIEEVQEDQIKDISEALSSCIECKKVNCIGAEGPNQLCENYCYHKMDCVAEVAAKVDDTGVCYTVYMQSKYGSPISQAMGVSECILIVAKKNNDPELCDTVSTYDTSMTRKYFKECEQFFSSN